MFWIFFHATFLHDGRKADRDRVVVPARCRFLDLRDEFFRRELHPGIEFPGVAVRDHQLHVRAADVDNEDLPFHRDDDARAIRRTRTSGRTRASPVSPRLRPAASIRRSPARETGTR